MVTLNRDEVSLGFWVRDEFTILLGLWAGGTVGWCQRSHSILRTVSAVQNWKLAGKAALDIDQSEASVGKRDLKLTNQREAGKNLSLVDQPRLIINDLHLHFSEADMTDVMELLCWTPTLSMAYIIEH